MKKVSYFLLFHTGAMVAGLMGNLVATYFEPAFAGAPWLAVLIFVFVSLATQWWAMREQGEAHPLTRDEMHQNETPRRLSAIRTLPPARLASATVVAGLALFTWYLAPLTNTIWADSKCSPGKPCILVAELTPLDNPIAQEMTRYIHRELIDVLTAAQASAIGVERVANVTNAQQAQAAANARDALLVIWGTVYEGEGVTQIYFHLSDALGITDNAAIRPVRVQPLLYGPLTERVECRDCLRFASELTQRADFLAYFAAGLSQYVSGEPEAARRNFLAALYCGNAFSDGAALMGAKPTCEPVQDEEEWNPALLYYYAGKSLLLQGDYGNAHLLLTEASSRNPLDPAALIGLGSLYQSWYGDPNAPRALEAFATAEARLEGLPLANLFLDGQVAVDSARGLVAELAGQPTGAIRHYQHALARVPDEQAVWAYVPLVNLARLLRLQAEAEDDAAARALAHSYLDRAVLLEPTAPWAFLERAYLMQAERRLAYMDLVRAAEARPDEAYVYLAQATLCRTWEDINCAQDAYDRALAVRPNSGWLHSLVGDFYLPTVSQNGRPDWQQAEQHYRRAVEIRPCDPWLHARYAYTLAAGPSQSLVEAVKHYQLALAFAPADAATESLQEALRYTLDKADLTEAPEVPLNPLCTPLALKTAS